MIFVDTNVFIHHVGRRHPLRDEARALVMRALELGQRLVTSAEVLQELLHYYHRSRRTAAMDDAFALLDRVVADVWPVEEADVTRARSLAERYPGLEARDLVHLACCVPAGRSRSRHLRPWVGCGVGGPAELRHR